MQGIWIICSGMAFILCFKEIDQIAEKLSGEGGGGGNKNMRLELTIYCPLATI
jgi:hypothetical protein